jgi:hypothetical protein
MPRIRCVAEQLDSCEEGDLTTAVLEELVRLADLGKLRFSRVLCC